MPPKRRTSLGRSTSADRRMEALRAIARKPRPNVQRRAQRSPPDRADTHIYDRGKSFMPSGENRIEKECTNQFLSNFCQKP